jgi:hypothetical protein
MPADVGSELAEIEDRDRGRADPVDVVVAVDAYASAGGDGRADPLARLAHVPEQERVVPRGRGFEEASGLARIGVAAARQDGCSRLADSEFAGQRARGAHLKRGDRP